MARKITAADKRARALQLKPAKRQNNSWQYFELGAKQTLGERMEAERYQRCMGYK